jgi:lipopolysaccharide/colanic/teichoic acid biosynthesis glycosyltransferase
VEHRRAAPVLERAPRRDEPRGPRPERPELIEGFKEEIPHYNVRHNIKPGVTGLAQVNGLRGDTCLRERVKFDLDYIENCNLGLDLQIMFMTLYKRGGAC